MNPAISDAETRCRAAWAAAPEAQFAWCCHHKVELEALTEPAENRIAYILSDKPENEQVRRLDNFRPVLSHIPAELTKACAKWNKARAKWTKAYAEWNKARAKWNKADAHRADVPHHTWNGRDIFTP